MFSTTPSRIESASVAGQLCDNSVSTLVCSLESMLGNFRLNIVLGFRATTFQSWSFGKTVPASVEFQVSACDSCGSAMFGIVHDFLIPNEHAGKR